MTANVDVIAATRTNVMIVPNSAVTDDRQRLNRDAPSNGKQVTRQVVIGLVGSSETEIVSGLSVGDIVVESTATSSTPPAARPRRAAAPPYVVVLARRRLPRRRRF